MARCPDRWTLRAASAERPGPLTLTSTGTISTSGGTGVFTGQTGFYPLNDGGITAASYGIYVATGSSVQIVNNGTIEACDFMKAEEIKHLPMCLRVIHIPREMYQNSRLLDR